jgi:SPX domain protein involved in polyphosphate accumulation
MLNLVERKYILDFPQYIFIKNKISQILQPDKFSQDNGKYAVHSVYYDTISHDFFHEKVDGNFLKRKVRVRWYGTDENKFLELKLKKGIFRQKYRDQITNTESITYQKVEQLNSQKSLFPTVQVSYLREAFQGKLSNSFVRINFDTEIIAKHMSNPDKSCQLLPKNILLEIKCFEVMPLFLTQLLEQSNLKLTSYSKYSEAFIKLTNTREVFL